MTKTYRDLVAAAKRQIREVAPREAWQLSHEGAVLVDVREPNEQAGGVIPGALLVARGVMESELPPKLPDLDTEVLLYCAAGNRSALAALVLQDMGYTRVASVAGGVTAWKAASLPWGTSGGLTPAQQERYSRHLTLPEVGEVGQAELFAGRVLLVGTGGLGSPAALYLAAAGVGTLAVVDDDAVEASNLQRQVIHTSARIGMPKVDSARLTLEGLNPDVTVETHRERLTSANVLDLMKDVDVVVDGADNFPTRYLINDASLRVGVPVVHGSVFRFEGQISVFTPYQGPCYRCLYAEPPPPELAPNCAEAGVLGVLPGVIGTLQAVETIKLLLGLGESLAGRLLTYDAMDQSFMTLNIRRNPDCPACGDEAMPPRIIDYDASCRAPAPA